MEIRCEKWNPIEILKRKKMMRFVNFCRAEQQKICSRFPQQQTDSLLQANRHGRTISKVKDRQAIELRQVRSIKRALRYRVSSSSGTAQMERLARYFLTWQLPSETHRQAIAVAARCYIELGKTCCSASNPRRSRFKNARRQHISALPYFNPIIIIVIPVRCWQATQKRMKWTFEHFLVT